MCVLRDLATFAGLRVTCLATRQTRHRANLLVSATESTTSSYRFPKRLGSHKRRSKWQASNSYGTRYEYSMVHMLAALSGRGWRVWMGHWVSPVVDGSLCIAIIAAGGLQVVCLHPDVWGRIRKEALRATCVNGSLGVALIAADGL